MKPSKQVCRMKCTLHGIQYQGYCIVNIIQKMFPHHRRVGSNKFLPRVHYGFWGT